MINVDIILWLYASLFWIGVLTCAVGLCLLLFPAFVLRLAGPLNRWVETDSWFGRLDQQRQFERWFYRYHYLTGGLIVIGAAYSLWYAWSLSANADVIGIFLGGLGDAGVREWLQSSLMMILIGGNVVALLVGAIVVVRPSLLKGVETWGNRWIDTERIFKRLDSRVDVTDRLIPRYPRLFGALVVIGSLYIMANTALVVLP